MAPSARPENVLQRAKELEAMDKGSAALDALYETVLSKRARSMTLPQLEPVFLKFVDLAVELRKGKVVKDGLHQYKKLLLAPAASTGDQGVEALEQAVSRLLTLSEEQVTRAQQQAQEVTVDDDLEEEKSPQDILLAMVSSEEAKDRTDREVVTPWLKFLWENYRSVLDVLRNNSKLETSYANVVQKAFAFCVQYNRKTEFRRLSELLRTHLQYAAAQSKAYHADLIAARAAALKQSGSKEVSPAQIAAQMPPNAPANPIDLSDGDTLQRFLDTRFEQLNVAVKLELWQEAFRSVEDIHTLLSATRRPIPVGSMATYYETLARIIAVSNNHLFHAATWFRYYSMVYTRRGPSAELRRIASFFLLSVMCIPRNEQPALTGRARRWMTLINLQRVPSRQALLDAALQRNVLDYASPELVELYTLLETSQFEPLTLREDIAVLTPKLTAEPAYKPYFAPLFNVVATSVFDELAKSYSEAKLSFVLGLVSLPEPFAASKAEIERVLVQGSTQQGYRVRIDHANGIVRFVDSLASPLAGTAGALLRDEVWALAQTLAHALGAKTPKAVHGDFAAEAREFAARKDREQRRTEQREKERTQLEEEQARERTRKAEELRAATEERAAREEAERAAALLKKETAEIALAEKRKLAESINAKGHVHVDLDNLENMSTEELQNMQVEQLDQEARSLEQRMAGVARRYDHLERALRREEAKLWRADAEEQADRDRETYKKRSEAIVNGARRTHEAGIAYAERFARLRESYATYMKGVKSVHERSIAEQTEKNAKALETAKQKRIAEETARREREKAEREQAEREAAEREALEKAERERTASEWRRPTAPAPAASAPAPGAYVPVWQRTGGASAAAPAAPAAAPSPASAAPPRASPFGAARAGAPAAGGASPFGTARPGAPATGGASPFGSAKPGSPATGGASPFGAAKPGSQAAGGASPFGAAKAGSPAAGGASPFGAAKAGSPATGGAGPFGSAKPVAPASGGGSPFGAAKAGAPAAGPQRTPANAQPKETNDSAPGRYVPPWKRAQQQ